MNHCHTGKGAMVRRVGEIIGGVAMFPLMCVSQAFIGATVLRRIGVDAELALGGLIARVGPGATDYVAYTNYDGTGFASAGTLFGHCYIRSGPDVIDYSLPYLLDDFLWLRDRDPAEFPQTFSAKFESYFGPASHVLSDRPRRIEPGSFILTPFRGDDHPHDFITPERRRFIDDALDRIEPQVAALRDEVLTAARSGDRSFNLKGGVK